MNIGRDTAAIIGDRDRAIGIEGYADLGRIAAQGLINGIIDHLIDHVMQARAVIGIANIHARALAHRIQALEHLDGFSAVIGGLGIGLGVLAGNGLFGGIVRFVGHQSSKVVKDPSST